MKECTCNVVVVLLFEGEIPTPPLPPPIPSLLLYSVCSSLHDRHENGGCLVASRKNEGYALHDAKKIAVS